MFFILPNEGEEDKFDLQQLIDVSSLKFKEKSYEIHIPQ